jgi:hypothetical protein
MISAFPFLILAALFSARGEYLSGVKLPFYSPDAKNHVPAATLATSPVVAKNLIFI